MMQDKEGLTIVEAVAFSGIRRSRMFQLIASGDLPARKVGPRRTIILRSELLAFLASLPQVAAKTTEAA